MADTISQSEWSLSERLAPLNTQKNDSAYIRGLSPIKIAFITHMIGAMLYHLPIFKLHVKHNQADVRTQST